MAVKLNPDKGSGSSCQRRGLKEPARLLPLQNGTNRRLEMYVQGIQRADKGQKLRGLLPLLLYYKSKD